MALVSRTILVNGSPEEVFDLTQDYSVRTAWDPFPERYALRSPSGSPEPGAEVHIRAKNGHEMTVRYVSFNRPRAAAMAMVSGPWFLEEFAGTWQFKPAADGQTEVTFKYRIVPKPHWLAWFLRPLLTHSFARHSERRLEGLKRYAAVHLGLLRQA
ncbi:SRPBCC family protein [Pseudoxanthomonas sp. NC8]|nr:SRPBCC family protein [Pseudoxanthomonas sp. NC8]